MPKSSSYRPLLFASIFVASVSFTNLSYSLEEAVESEDWDDPAAIAKELMELGVIVNTGAHGQREGLATHWEMWSFAEGGMSPMQMLSTATINPAKYLGMDQDLGSIEVGKLADLQIVDGNPLVDVKATDQITHVMVNGRLYRAGDLAEEVTGDAPAPKLWWHDQPQHEIR